MTVSGGALAQPSRTPRERVAQTSLRPRNARAGGKKRRRFAAYARRASPSAELDAELGRGLVPEVVLERVDLDVGQRPVHAPVRDAVAVRRLARLGVCERVDVLDALDELARDGSRELVEVVLLVRLRAPKRNILEDGRVLAVPADAGGRSGPRSSEAGSSEATVSPRRRARRADRPRTGRGDAARAARIVRGRVAATPRAPRGSSARIAARGELRSVRPRTSPKFRQQDPRPLRAAHKGKCTPKAPRRCPPGARTCASRSATSASSRRAHGRWSSRSIASLSLSCATSEGGEWFGLRPPEPMMACVLSLGSLFAVPHGSWLACRRLAGADRSRTDAINGCKGVVARCGLQRRQISSWRSGGVTTGVVCHSLGQLQW